MKTRYTEIVGTDKQIATFLKRVKLPIDELVERAEKALDMFPDSLHINIKLFDTADDVRGCYRQKYNKNCDYVAFISLDQTTIYCSVRDASTDVVTHELGHAIVETFFTERPPYKIHELMAQYCAKHIGD